MNCLKKTGIGLLLTGVLIAVGSTDVQGWSRLGTPQRVAEEDAAAKMRRNWPAYQILDVQMRSNELSISIPTRNAIGRQVNFSAPVRKYVGRNGAVTYYVGDPQPIY